MKSIIVKWFKDRGIRTIKGVKVEKINFYELCGYEKMIEEGKPIEVSH